MSRLTSEQIVRDNKNLDPSSTTSLNLSHRALSDVSCVSSFTSLERLDLSFNCLSSLEGLASCINLKWLSLVENKLESLKGIEGLSKLTVFNAGKNKLKKIDEISSVTSLRALILNDNNISSICKLDQLQHLNTLVLSKNPIYDIGDSLMKAKSLTKLSLSHCHLERIGRSLKSCVELKELRLAHNKITTISSELAQNTRLQNLDMGNNLIETWSELKVLSALPNLKNLNFQGNPIAEKDKLAKKVKELVPNLQILNAKPIENGNKGKRFRGEDTLYPSKADPPLRKVSDVEDGKETERKKSKKDVEDSGIDVTKRSSEVHTADEVGKKSKPNRSKTSESKRRTSNQNENDNFESAAKKANSKGFKNEEDLSCMDADDLELDPFLSEKTSQYIDREKKDRKVVDDGKKLGGFVIEHKRKKAKSIQMDTSALKLLTRSSDIGLGGPSTWDD